MVRDFPRRLKMYAEDCSTGLLKEAYDRAAGEMPSAAAHLTYTQVSRTMSAWRRSKWPRNPSSPGDTVRIFEAAAAEGAPFAKFFYCGGESANGVYLLFVNNSNIMQSKLAVTTTVQADATFRTAPKLFYQILFLFCEVNEVTTVFGAAWMTSKCAGLYQEVMDAVKDIIPPTCRPRHLMTDFESALRSALAGLFPGVVPDGCFFLTPRYEILYHPHIKTML